MSARMILLMIKLMVPVIGVCGYFAFDFYTVNKFARMGDGDGVSVGEYISGIVPGAAAIGVGVEAPPDMPTALVDMLPKAPEGWVIRPTEPGDIAAYMPENVDEKAALYVGAVVNPRGGNGTEEARLTYTNGPKLVVFEAVRHPNFIFTSFGATQLKMELQFTSSLYRGSDFMTVRGMEFTEDLLPEEAGLRYFYGNVSSQIWIRVLATRSMTDMDMLPFFETLHVPAINASVVDKVSGMGEVPVIVLTSAMDAERRAAREAEKGEGQLSRAQEREKKKAERAAEKAAAKLKKAADREAAQAAAAAEKAEAQKKAADRAKGIEQDEATGVIIRKGTGKEKKSAKTTAGFGDDGCKMVGARKVCGGPDGD